MRRAAALFCFLACLAVLAGGPVPEARAQSSGAEIVVAQNSGPGGFFRRLFGGNRRQTTPPQAPPFQIFPEFGAPPPAEPRRERRARTAAPQPREVAAVEKAPDAKRALVVGDFMAGALAKGLADAFRDNPNAVAIDASSGSSGLVRSDYYDWPAKVVELANEQKPDAILVMIGGNDRQTMQTEAGSLDFNSDAWRAAYTARVAALADALKATGKPVLWGGLVPVAPTAMSRDYSAFNGIVREQLDAKGLKFVDMWNGFADEDGKYVAFGPDVSGQSVQLRADDGLNFTRAGQRKLAYFVEQDLNDIFGGATPVIASVAPIISPGAAEASLIGPMVPLDALGLMGGDALAGGVLEGERGNVAVTISARVVKEDAASPPKTRVDSFLWPPPLEAAETPSAPTLRGPR